MSRFIDLSHPIEEGMETYRPLPTPRVDVLNDYDASRYDGKSEFLIASLHVCGNTGTYVDSPKHRYRQGVDLAGLPLERLADMPRPAHTILLGAGVPVCEHMTNLASVESGTGRLHAVPIAWVGGATFPVRAYIVSDQ